MTFHSIRPIILASGSPRRREFLTLTGLEFTISSADGSAEPRPENDSSPEAYVLAAAAAKSASCTAKKNDALVIAADTIVALGNEILGKPADEKEAFTMLKKLSGQTHRVLTAVYLHDPLYGDESFTDTASVHFAEWPDEVLRAYVRTGDSLDKAGAYGIQSRGHFLSDGIEGAWDTVAGLPVCRLMQLLIRHKAAEPRI